MSEKPPETARKQDFVELGEGEIATQLQSHQSDVMNYNTIVLKAKDEMEKAKDEMEKAMGRWETWNILNQRLQAIRAKQQQGGKE